jgi:transketolase
LAWREAGRRGAAERDAWTGRVEALDPATKAEFARRMHRKLPDGFGPALQELKAQLVSAPQEVATRKASELALTAIAKVMPELVLGSADLTPSNNTRVNNPTALAPGAYGGRYIHYGIREHAMAAAMNGIAIHGGFRPAGATFLVFADYARPAIRISALGGIPVVYVMTHDSIGLGEDGPTHQPVEHLASLRSMPNLRVFRPADAVETAECWQLALERTDGPTLLALTRQNLPQVRREASDANLSSHGAYEIAGADGDAHAAIFASGSEVSIAIEAQALLAAKGVRARVVSVPSLELFLAQPEDRKRQIIGAAPVKVAVEAAVRFGWDGVIGPDGIFVGMSGFGASAPYKDLYRHFGITAEAVAERVLRTHNL